ncbi:hypothetical protein BD408DRAFT_423813 [Parasitella parasitica]|nr:hypothetical protein BD408DRAFT_423813 [Parasitella parasitica]
MPVQCQECRKMCRDKHAYQRHSYHSHSMEMKIITFNNEQMTFKRADDGYFECGCRKRYKSARYFEEHILYKCSLFAGQVIIRGYYTSAETNKALEESKAVPKDIAFKDTAPKTLVAERMVTKDRSKIVLSFVFVFHIVLLTLFCIRYTYA